MLPSDIVTVPVTWSDGQSHAGDQLITSISFTPSQTVIHAASGIPLINVTWGDLSRGRIDLPAVNQEGFMDDQGDQVSGWHYLAAITYRSGGQVRVVEKRFQPLTGQSGIDIDLLPAQNPVDPPVIVVRGVSSVGDGRTGDVSSAVLAGDILPFLPTVDVGVTSFNGQTGDVVADASSLGADVAGSASTAEANAKDYADGLVSTLPAITPETQSALDLKADLVGGVVPSSQLPAIAITDFLGQVNSEVEMLDLTGQKGDFCIRTDLEKVFIITGPDPAQLTSWTALAYPPAPVQSVNAQVGDVMLGRSDVGLGNVDNTSDVDKPISTATATALASKADLVAGAVPLAQLPANASATAGTLILRDANGRAKVADGATGEDVVNRQQLNSVQNAGARVVVHGATAGTARPAGALLVIWKGSVDPTNKIAGDVWVEVP